MKLRCRSRSLPSSFKSHPKGGGIIFEHDLQIGTSRLRAKLLVFQNCKELRAFWERALGRPDLGRHCKGAVNSLVQEVDCNGSRYLEADPRYFCVIGLVKRWFGGMIVTHESVHAGFAYEKRIRRTPWDDQIRYFEEESIAYPAGKIAQAINVIYWKHKELFA